MDARPAVADLKRRLLAEVRLLFSRNGSVWKEPLLDVVRDLRESRVRAVLFGCTLRSLLASRIFEGRPGRPRDIDVVVAGVPLPWLEEKLADILTRRTRFGVLRLERGPWRFDLWPVAETWAFRQDAGGGPASFSALPSTTTFNLEAVAVEAWTRGGRPRALFSGDDRFFEGIRARTVELNREDNPFPELTVVRGLILASELRFRIGPRLAGYIGRVAASMSEEVVERVQAGHYGHARVDSRTLCELIAAVARRPARGEGCELPAMGQLDLWPEARHDRRRGHLDTRSAAAIIGRGAPGRDGAPRSRAGNGEGGRTMSHRSVAAVLAAVGIAVLAPGAAAAAADRLARSDRARPNPDRGKPAAGRTAPGSKSGGARNLA